MKKLFLLLLILLLAGAWLGQLMIQDAGYVLLAYQHTTVETSIWVMLVILLVAFIVMHLLLNLISSMGLPTGRIKEWRLKRRQQAARKATLKGMLAMSEGNWLKARRELVRSADDASVPLINLLAAAKAAHESGDKAGADELLSKALKAEPDAETAVTLAQTQIQLARGQSREALDNLLNLRKLAPKNTQVMLLLKDAYLQLQDWQGLSELLPVLRRHRALTEEQQLALEQQCYLIQLEQILSQADDSTNEAGVKALQSFWQKLPTPATSQEALVSRYAELLGKLDAGSKAEALLRDSLNQHWSNKLVIQYGCINSGKPKKQLDTARQWLEQQGESAELMLTLGRLSLLNHNWGGAVEYFESSLRLQPTAEAYGELSRLYHHLGDKEQAQQMVGRAVEVSGQGLPSLPMPQPALAGSATPA
ncbi:heme biosynthesis HemY N-terminal domain-containing protein [Nitrincola alkalilacustris]|uniref:heme biosynthesis HemY N-terminal domain-containing protein n=1 Tax=Nitrincola alkalilacustris TaxID=1571224 RepID=UPI00124D7B92|nr:heme biosynthesis HemY N-terminal domain-containing protein [Nitrincola alkalilacustris]